MPVGIIILVKLLLEVASFQQRRARYLFSPTLLDFCVEIGEDTSFYYNLSLNGN